MMLAGTNQPGAKLEVFFLVLGGMEGEKMMAKPQQHGKYHRQR